MTTPTPVAWIPDDALEMLAPPRIRLLDVPLITYGGENHTALFTESQMQQACADALREAAELCDELETHYSGYAHTALLNGDVALSNAASGEPRAARFIAEKLRMMAGEIEGEKK